MEIKTIENNVITSEKDIVSKIIDKIFSMKRTTIYLILVFLLAFILRLIAAINLSVSADDMHHVTAAINFFSSGKLITYDQSAGLWHSFTSLIYKIFGMTQLTSRFAALLFGSFTVFIIFMLAKEFFDEKISLISAFLLAITPFHIKNTIAEMDVMAMFFVLLGMLLFIRAMKTNSYQKYALSGTSMGLAIYTKVYPLLFIPSLLLYFVYIKRSSKKQIINKDNIKKIFVFLVVIFVFAIPVLTHNYLLYKDKGLLDLQFTRVTGLGKDISAQYYSWDVQFEAKNDWLGLILPNSFSSKSYNRPMLLVAINYIRLGDPIIFYLGLIGLVLILINKQYRKEKKDYLVFFFLGILFVLPFLASIILLPKHYIFLELFLIPVGAFSLYEISKKISKSVGKDVTKVSIVIVLLFSLILLGLQTIPFIYSSNAAYHFYGKSHVAQVIDFKEENIPENSLIVADSRIYRGRINWFSQGRPYLEGTDFIRLVNQQDQIPGNPVSINTFFIECVIDDCGWGGGQVQGEFNTSMESLADFFKQNGQLVRTIYEPEREKSYFPLLSNNKIELTRIYSAQIQIKDSIITFANQPKNWFLYDIGYQPKEKQFDYYNTNGIFDTLLNKIAHWIVLFAVISAFLSPLYVVYLIFKNEKNINNHTSL